MTTTITCATKRAIERYEVANRRKQAVERTSYSAYLTGPKDNVAGNVVCALFRVAIIALLALDDMLCVCVLS